LVTQLIRNSKGNQEAKVRVAEEHTKRMELRLAFKQSKWEQELVARKEETEARKEELQRFQEVLREERRRYEEARNEDLKRLQEARREDREMLMGLMQQMNASKEHNT
jgi:cysteinyl-tRNA synthetase